MKGKRINFPEGEETMFSGPYNNGVYMTGVEVHLRGDQPKDPLASAPTVMLWPIDRKSKAWHDKGLSFPASTLDELIQALENVREELAGTSA